MVNGDQFSRYPSLRGVSLDLPFVKFRYVRVENSTPEESEPYRQISATVPGDDQASPVPAPRRLIISREAEATTMGMDPLVSNASVIHELAYGRIGPFESFLPAASYPATKEPARHSLDMIV